MEQGNAVAQNNLGLMYEKGLGVEKDYPKTVGWYTKAAEQGYAEAQNNLGYMYYAGLGVEENYPKAVELYTKATIRDKTYQKYFPKNLFVISNNRASQSIETLQEPVDMQESINVLRDNLESLKERMIYFEGYFGVDIMVE